MLQNGTDFHSDFNHWRQELGSARLKMQNAQTEIKHEPAGKLTAKTETQLNQIMQGKTASSQRE